MESNSKTQNRILKWLDRAISHACKIGRDDEYEAITNKYLRTEFRMGEVVHITVGKVRII